jgi:Xaa-Pro aminopeptidase
MMASPKDVYAQRRRAFMDRLGPGAAAVIPAAPVALRSYDVEYPYHQDSDFLYLTGFPEPEAVCLLLPGHPKNEFVLFLRPRNPERETWTGARAGVEGAIADYGADMAYPIGALDEQIGTFVGERDRLYYRAGRDAAFDRRVLAWMQQWQLTRPRSGTGPTAILDSGEILHEMRMVKGDRELACIRKAVAISAEAHHAAMRTARAGMYEYEIEAVVDYTFRRLAAVGPAYPSIVAGGHNATVLHYTTNDKQLRAGDLLLIDAGADHAGYCADITRTFPVAERFSTAQRAIYDIVLQAQLAGIEAIRPGARHEEIHQRAVEVLVDGLLSLHLLTGDRHEIIEKELYRPFYMHRTSHWLGMDVHDVGLYKSQGNSRILEPGMIMTVEPGLYIAPDRTDIDPQYLGIGIRIEDDVLVTPEGHEVLSAAIAKDPGEIEALRREASRR